MDENHSKWISELYGMYHQGIFPHSRHTEVILDDPLYRSTPFDHFQPTFEQEWLERYPPLIRRQNAMS